MPTPVSSSRLLFLVGESIPIGRLLHVSRTVSFPENARFLSRISRDNGPLTLASLGFRTEFETASKIKSDKLNKADSTAEEPKRKTRSLSKEPKRSKTEFAPDEFRRKKEFSFEETKSKSKVIRAKDIGAKMKVLEIEAAPFAAESFSELGACRFLVLDEVDELLAFNFREDMHRIVEHVGRKAGAGSDKTKSLPGRQTIVVYATVPFSVARAAQGQLFLSDRYQLVLILDRRCFRWSLF